jgi:protein-serine/threonine kinase
MSPEQVQFVRTDLRSDLFALGVMLYHFTTGERPFGSPESVRGLRRRLYVDPVPPRTLRRDCPPWLQEVILKCLEVKPDRRWQSAGQLALALQDPSQVPLTARAERQQSNGAVKRLKGWFFAVGAEAAAEPRVAIASQVMQSPIILAAVDVENAEAGLLERLRETVRRIVLTEPGARLACISVMKTARIGMDEKLDAEGKSVHVNQLVGLKHWARPISKQLDLGEGRLTFHVLEAPDAASAIVEFAERNQVDHIVMGARGNSAIRRYLGSVSSQVVAQAQCTVTVVRI